MRIGSADGKTLRQSGNNVYQPKRTELRISINFVAIFRREAARRKHHADKADHRQVERRYHHVTQ
ncbi:hypothetical protein D3C76_1863870 [compost metagenome]